MPATVRSTDEAVLVGGVVPPGQVDLPRRDGGDDEGVGRRGAGFAHLDEVDLVVDGVAGRC